MLLFGDKQIVDALREISFDVFTDPQEIPSGLNLPASSAMQNQMNRVLCTLSVLLVCLVKKSSAKIIKSTLIIKRLLNLG